MGVSNYGPCQQLWSVSAIMVRVSNCGPCQQSCQQRTSRATPCQGARFGSP
jgi:hypothetical protein